MMLEPPHSQKPETPRTSAAHVVPMGGGAEDGGGYGSQVGQPRLRPPGSQSRVLGAAHASPSGSSLRRRSGTGRIC